MTAAARALKVVRRDGARIAARRVAERVRPLVWLEEQHVWYQLDLPVDGAGPWDATDGLRLVSPGRADAELAPFAQLPTVHPAGARGRMDEGGTPYLVLEGAQAVFACWIWPRSVPVLAARGGFLGLPDGVVCLEDSVASPLARGRGIAPRTWTALAHTWAQRGATAMITKVGVDNVPSRRAVTKAGFREIGVQSHRRRGPAVRVDVAPLGPPGGLGEALRERLRR